MQTLDSDLAQDNQDDPFGRLAFAQRLARCLHLPPGQDSVVLGLEGEWGGGKSWVIERCCHELQQLPDVIVLQFNPWLIGSETELIAAFMEELAAQLREFAAHRSQLEDKLREVARTLASYGDKLSYLKYLKYVPGLAPVGQFVADHEKELAQGADALKKAVAADKPSLQAARRQIHDALQALNKSVVVVIDDLDRLRRQEIQTMLQLVKAVANFKGVHYLLAYDPRYVAQAVAHDGTPETGFAYLEKIVQLSCRLPPLVPWVFRDWLQDSMLQCVASQQRQLTPFEQSQLEDAMWHVARQLRHPRDARRWLNRLRWILSAGEQLNLGDLLVAEALQIVAPEALRVLAADPALLFLPHEQDFAASEFGLVASYTQRRAWVEHVSDDADLLRTLVWLFPQLQHKDFAGTPDPDARHNRRLQVYQCWMQYLQQNSLTQGQDQRMLQKVLADPVRYARILARVASSAELGQFCQQIHTCLLPQVVTQPAYLFECLVESASANATSKLLPEQLQWCANCLLRLLDSVPASTQAALLHRLLQQGPSSLSAQVLLQRPSLQATYGELWWQQLQQRMPSAFTQDNGTLLLQSCARLAWVFAARRLAGSCLDLFLGRESMLFLFDNRLQEDALYAILRLLPPAARLLPQLDKGRNYRKLISWLDTPQVTDRLAQQRQEVLASLLAERQHGVHRSAAGRRWRAPLTEAE